MWGLAKCRGRLVALLLVMLVAIVLAMISTVLTLVTGDLTYDTPQCNCPKHKGFLRSWLNSEDPIERLADKLLERLNGSSPLIVLNITNVVNSNAQGGSYEVVYPGKKRITPKDNIAPETKALLSHFEPVMNPEQKAALFNAFVKLAEASTIHNFTYMMYSGTLLGSYRHHDMVPWDDDLDIFMDYNERMKIVKALDGYKPQFEVRSAGARVKFFSTEGTQTSKYPWKWPYLDISFFKQNETHIWDGSMEDDYGDRYYLYKKEIVFPLHDRPMGSYFFKAPRDSFAHIKRTYGPHTFDQCTTSHYSHKNEALTDKIHKIPCESLAQIYPFVHRTPTKGGVRETLMLSGKILHSVVVPEPEYAISKPYKLELV